MESKIKGEIEGGKKGCPISKNSRKKTQNDTWALETRKRDEKKAVSFLLDSAQSNLFRVAKRKKKRKKKDVPRLKRGLQLLWDLLRSYLTSGPSENTDVAQTNKTPQKTTGKSRKASDSVLSVSDF